MVGLPSLTFAKRCESYHRSLQGVSWRRRSMSATTTTTAGTHILVIPYPAQGHLIPLLDLTHRLCVRGFIITVVVTPKNLHLLQPLISNSPSIQTLVLPFPNSPDVPPGVENVKDLPPGIPNPVVMGALRGLHDPLVDWFQSHLSPPHVILSDFFTGWTHHLAQQLGIPRLVFYSSGACLILVTNWLWDHFSLLEPADSDLVTISDIPNSPSFFYRQLPAIFRRYWENKAKMGFIKDGMTANNSSWGGIFNSFEALEGRYLEHLKEENGHSRLWAVGPLLPSEDVSGRGGSPSIPTDQLLEWLDAFPESSVVYICFGSQVSLTRPQCKELAVGIEKSGARFIWCVKVDGSGCEYGAVPLGFEERTAERGLVIKGWAPQVAILKHRAVGAFLTHCGWNSVLEGIIAGVTLLTWPMAGDQFVNSKMLVHDMGVAVQVCEGPDTVPDSDHLARALSESVSSAGPEKARAAELQKAAMDALKEGGSSKNDLEDLVEALSALPNEKIGR